MKIMASGPTTSWEIDGETVETVSDFIFLAPKSLQMGTAALKLRCLLSVVKNPPDSAGDEGLNPGSRIPGPPVASLAHEPTGQPSYPQEPLNTPEGITQTKSHTSIHENFC